MKIPSLTRGLPRISPSLFLFSICAACAAGSGANADTLYPQPVFAVGAGPVSSATADFNGDGVPDVVTAGSAAGSVSVLLGGAAGVFKPAENYSVSSGNVPVGVAVGDFNGDGKPDIATIDATTSGSGSSTTTSIHTISILLNKGDGTFALKKTIDAGTELAALAAHDVDGDGNADLVTADSATDNISIFSGDGKGDFGTARTLPTGGDAPVGVAIADVNDDNHPDIVSANATSKNISVFLGDGKGGFSDGNGNADTAATYSVGVQPATVAVGDVTGDGDADVVVTTRNQVTKATPNPDNYVAVVAGDGSGSFGNPSKMKLPSDSAALVVADLNDDGTDDIAATDTYLGASQVSVFISNGKGKFASATNYGTGLSPHGISAADFDGDGNTDLAVAGADSSDVVLLSGDGKGKFITHRSLDTPDAPVAVAVADVDGDGKADIVTANFGQSEKNPGNSVSVFSNADNDHRHDYPTGKGPHDVRILDLNGDGDLDAVTANSHSNSISVLLNKGSGKLGTAKDYATGKDPVAMDVADVDGDGVDDVVVANDPPSGSKNPKGSISVLTGNSDGTFNKRKDYDAGIHPVDVALGDLNGDDHPDVVIANYNGNSISVLLNNGDGSFGKPKAYKVDSSATPNSVALGDFNNDGKLDVAVAASDAGKVGIYLGNGDGTLGKPNFVRVAGQPQGITVADVNGDGNADILTANEPDSASLLLGHGDGTFSTHQEYLASLAPFAVTAKDINGDGELDIVVANEGSDSVTVMPQAAGKSNVAPVVEDLSIKVDEGKSVKKKFKGSDKNGDKITYKVATKPEHGKVSVSGDGPSFTYTPDSSYSGSDSFTYTASDGTLTSEPGTVSVTVNATGGGSSGGSGSSGSSSGGGGGGGGAGGPLGLALFGLLAVAVSRGRLRQSR